MRPAPDHEDLYLHNTPWITVSPNGGLGRVLRCERCYAFAPVPNEPAAEYDRQVRAFAEHHGACR